MEIKSYILGHLDIFVMIVFIIIYCKIIQPIFLSSITVAIITSLKNQNSKSH